MTFLPLFSLGSALGDGSIGICTNRPNSRYLSFTHSAKQRDYLTYKIKRINAELGTKGNVSLPKATYDARTGNTYFSCQSMVVNPLLKPLYSLLYPKGVKQFSKEVLALLGLEALAVFWMDDGSVVASKYCTNRGILNTYTPLDQTEIICEWLNNLTEVNSVPYLDGDSYKIRINASEMPQFVCRVRPYVHSSMRKKVTLSYSHYNTKSKRVFESSLNIPFVDDGDKTARARDSIIAGDIV